MGKIYLCGIVLKTTTDHEAPGFVARRTWLSGMCATVVRRTCEAPGLVYCYWYLFKSVTGTNDTDCLFSLDFLLASNLSSLSNDHRWSHPILGFSQPLKFKMDFDFDLTLQSQVIINQSWQVDLWKGVQGCSGIAESPGGVSTHESEPLRVCLC